MKRSIVLAMCCLFALASTAMARDVPGPAGSNLKVWAPDDFKLDAMEHHGEAVMLAISPHRDCAFVWALADAPNLEKALGGLDALLSSFVTDGKIVKTKQVTWNGKPALAVGGTAKYAGQPTTVALLLLQPAPGKVLVVIGLVVTAKKSAYDKTLGRVLAGIRPAR